jgi:group II intron reverse transcriptase/maturase
MENPAPNDASLASVQGSTGVEQDRGMCEEKRNDDHPAEGGTLNSGRRMAPAAEEIYLQRPNDFQPKEGVAKSHLESDLPIVVRDGNTDHTAKDQAGMQRGQSTHARGRNTLDESVSRTLSALGTKAGKEPGHRFRGLARLLDRQMLGEAFRRLKRKAAPGIDGVTHGEYAENLEENLLALESRLREGSYRALPVRRRWIAKTGNGKLRPLGIPVLEDKIVQQAVRMILEPIWENDFADESIGYRPGRSPRQATQELGEALHDGKHRWVVEADIRGFFDHINHDWLIQMLEQRIADRGLIRIIRKWLKAGVIEELKKWSPSYEGTPQGGIISPLLGNIYLHFVQDLWIKKVVAKKSKGSVMFRRYADDSIVCFERKDDAEAYLRALPERLAKFGLQLADEKSALVKFNRWEGASSGRFTFLGFDFHWGKSRDNPKYWRVRRTTNPKKFRAGLASLKGWLKKSRSLPLPEIVTMLKGKLQGVWNYYGVIGNSERNGRFAWFAKRLVLKWLNRRSQRRSFTWATFNEAWERWKIPSPRVIEKPWSHARQDQPHSVRNVQPIRVQS